MNPVFRNIYVSFTICVILSACYAYTFGRLADFVLWQMFVDAWIFGVIMKLEMALMWYVMKYNTVELSSWYKIVYRFIWGTMIVASVMGIETILVYFISGNSFSLFAATIPSRMFVMALIYVIIVRYYKGLLMLEKEIPEDFDEKIEEKGHTPVEVLEHITVRNGQKIKMINLSDLIYIRAEGDYVELVTSDGKWLKELTMKYLEEHLPIQDFVRVHRSYIVRLACISRVERYGQQQLIELRNGDKIKISATGYKQLRLKLNL